MGDRKKFNDVVRETIEELFRQLIEDIPEVDGISCAVLYAGDIGETQPQIMAVTRNADPVLECGMMEQTLQLLRAQTQQMAGRIKALYDATKQAKDEEDANKADETPGRPEAESTDTGDPATSGSAETP